MRLRIAVALVATASLLAPVNFMAVMNYRSLLQEVRQLTEVEAAQLRAVAEVQSLLARALREERAWVSSGASEHGASARSHLDAAVARCRDAVDLSDRERAAFGRLGRDLMTLRATLEDGPAVPGTGEPGTGAGIGLQVRRDSMSAAAMAAHQELAGISDRAWDALSAARMAIGNKARKGLRNLISALLVTLVGLAFVILWVPAMVTRPLLRLRMMVRHIEREDLDRLRPDTFPADESRRLAQAVLGTLVRRQEILRMQKKRIRLLEKRFRRLLDGIREPVLVIRHDGQVAACGQPAARLLDSPARSLEGKPVAEILGGEELPALLVRLERGEDLEPRERQVEVILHEGAAGSSRLSVRVDATYDEDGRMRQALVFLKPPVAP